ncbi:MAG: hypothetical protein NVSMB56_08240 [Pyrinomonadaceae bacterium]
MSDEKSNTATATTDAAIDENMSYEAAPIDEAVAVEDAHGDAIPHAVDEIRSSENAHTTNIESSHEVSRNVTTPPVTRTAPAYVEKENRVHEIHETNENMSYQAHAVESQSESVKRTPDENVSSGVMHTEDSSNHFASSLMLHDESSVSTTHDDDSNHIGEAAHEIPVTREVAIPAEPPPTREIKIPEPQSETVRPLAYSPAIFASYDKRPTRLDKFQRAASNALAEGKERTVARFGEDETADDSGVRFVLIAAALFVVALVLFIFSTILK